MGESQLRSQGSFNYKVSKEKPHSTWKNSDLGRKNVDLILCEFNLSIPEDAVNGTDVEEEVDF